MLTYADVRQWNRAIDFSTQTLQLEESQIPKKKSPAAEKAAPLDTLRVGKALYRRAVFTHTFRFKE
jgi:hypothetical protein